MKIAVSTSGKDLDSQVEPRFGRAVGFVIYDTENKTSEYIANTQISAPRCGWGDRSRRGLLCDRGLQ